MFRLMIAIALVAASSSFGHGADAPARRPNVILIITDDHGWGDFGFHGNAQIHTPNLDRLSRESVELTQFYVSPVCSPTRASLMTGRYNYRTGAIDTFLGRSTMVAEEVTLAEMFSSAGYRTAIFGKWHLGDNYPSRAMDQGFAESLVHRGGGMVQPADPPGGSYFDPILMHNGHEEKSHGYCSDVFANAAASFIERNKANPFFVYLAFNCPHTPLQLPEEYLARYQDQGLDDATARVYGMIANIDDNLGRLFAKLDSLELADDTIVVFLTDNGPQQPRYTGVLRDRKGSVYEGGIHVPCLVRWPGHLAAGAKCDQVAAHIDLAPTLLSACGLAPPENVRFDGANLWPNLTNRSAPDPKLSDRLLFFQWHRGDVPERGRACAVRGPQYKLVQAEGRAEQMDFAPTWELYDLASDPGEQHNVIEQHAGVAETMRKAYDAWFDDVGSTRGYPAPKIIAGTQHENPVTLTRQDWRGPKAGWREDGVGYWDVDFATAGHYDVTLRMPALKQASTAKLQVGKLQKSQRLEAGAASVTFSGLQLPAGTHRVQGTFESKGQSAGVHYVDLSLHQ
jgi:arylsulfatase A-like enzyme